MPADQPGVHHLVAEAVPAEVFDKTCSRPWSMPGERTALSYLFVLAGKDQADAPEVHLELLAPGVGRPPAR
jgi:hypothetical protein